MTETIFAIIGVIGLLLTAILQLLLALGFPLADLAFGGNYSGKLPRALRIMSGASLLVLLFASVIFLAKGDIVNVSLSDSTVNGLMLFFTAYTGLNTIGNLASKSKRERLFATPLSVGIFVSGLVLVV